MAIHRWDPNRDLMQLQERMNRLFEDVFARSAAAGGAEPVLSGGWTPAVDIFEQSDRYVLRADLPGVPSGDVEIAVENGTLSVRGERKSDPAVPREAFLRMERATGKFSVDIALPPTVDRDGIQAAQRDGVLEIVLPKKEKGPERVKIEVR